MGVVDDAETDADVTAEKAANVFIARDGAG
jgi:hypothetical protein